MSQASLDLKIRFLCQKVCSVVRVQTDTQTDRQTNTKVNTEDTLSGFQECLLQPIIKDQSNKNKEKSLTRVPHGRNDLCGEFSHLVQC